MKRIRIDNVASMITEIRLFLKYWIPDSLQIMNFNVNGSLLDMSLFIDRLWENVIGKVSNLYMYYLNYTEEDVEKLCEGVRKNANFQDLRIYASKIDIKLLSKYLYENNSIWLLSLSFNELKLVDVEPIIEILKKLKKLKEFCAHHNQLEDDGWMEIVTFISENCMKRMDYIDLSHNNTSNDDYIKFLKEKGFKGIIK